jgi:hypothetical protein
MRDKGLPGVRPGLKKGFFSLVLLCYKLLMLKRLASGIF